MPNKIIKNGDFKQIMGNYFMPYSLRIDEELKEKLKVVAKTNRRTLNMEITVACEEYVRKYEEEYGNIEVEM